jgi:predicted transcriptional regulator
MSCINADGTLTKTAEKVMSVIGDSSKDTEIAAQINFPVYLVRSSLRQLVELGLVCEVDKRYSLTELGIEKL